MNRNLKKLLIGPSLKVSKAISMLNTNEEKILFVIDSRKSLIGTVTDGDIRRSLIKKLDTNICVSEVMNRKPIYSYESSDKQKLKYILKRKLILHIPIVNKNKKILSIYSLNNEIRNIENIVLIMAGGFGKRLWPLTSDTPKPMIKIGEKPILEKIIEGFINHGFKNFIISTHYLPKKIKSYFKDGKKWNINISYLSEKYPLGTAGAMSLLKIENDLPIIVSNGDVITNLNYKELLKFHNKNKSDITMGVKEYKIQVPYGVISTRGHKIREIREKPLQNFHVNSGIYIFNKDIIKKIKAGKKLSMSDLINKIIKSNKKVLAFPIHEQWIDIGNIKELNKALSKYSI